MEKDKKAQDPGSFRLPDPALVSRTMADVAERSQRLVGDFLKRQASDPAEANADAMNIGAAFMEMTQDDVEYRVAA